MKRFYRLVAMSVVVDSREASSHKRMVEMLSRRLEVEVKFLPVGDYLLSNKLLVEHKDVLGFVNDMRSGRLREQVRLLKGVDGCDKCILIEGWLGLIQRFSRIKPSAVARCIDTLIFHYGIPVIQLPNKEWTVEWLVAKAISLEEARVKRPPVIQRPKRTVKEVVLSVLQSLPGISSERSIKIVKSGLFKDLQDFVMHPGRLIHLKGIGEKTVKSVEEALRYPWKNLLEG